MTLPLLPACRLSMAMPKVKLLTSSSMVSPSTNERSNRSLPVGPPAVALESTANVANSTEKISKSLIR
ncbi:Uncharacterised protein [Bordetella pertussis]|nr:Uncharacterised protein [Bordetella pertussis]